MLTISKSKLQAVCCIIFIQFYYVGGNKSPYGTFIFIKISNFQDLSSQLGWLRISVIQECIHQRREWSIAHLYSCVAWRNSLHFSLRKTFRLVIFIHARNCALKGRIITVLNSTTCTKKLVNYIFHSLDILLCSICLKYKNIIYNT